MEPHLKILSSKVKSTFYTVKCLVFRLLSLLLSLLGQTSQKAKSTQLTADSFFMRRLLLINEELTPLIHTCCKPSFSFAPISCLKVFTKEFALSFSCWVTSSLSRKLSRSSQTPQKKNRKRSCPAGDDDDGFAIYDSNVAFRTRNGGAERENEEFGLIFAPH